MLPRSPVYEYSSIYGKHTPFCPHCGRMLITYDHRAKDYLPNVWRNTCQGCGQVIKWGMVGVKVRFGFRRMKRVINGT